MRRVLLLFERQKYQWTWALTEGTHKCQASSANGRFICDIGKMQSGSAKADRRWRRLSRPSNFGAYYIIFTLNKKKHEQQQIFHIKVWTLGDVFSKSHTIIILASWLYIISIIYTYIFRCSKVQSIDLLNIFCISVTLNKSFGVSRECFMGCNLDLCDW